MPIIEISFVGGSAANLGKIRDPENGESSLAKNSRHCSMKETKIPQRITDIPQVHGACGQLHKDEVNQSD
ncbi:hypothetical protein HGP14_24695 [Rhizobium sp. P32RR-XVIII]|uniref:hypothetical protein n=1 Tax=Rhizobium sp. P32RR-XVIII TaxID=2726738 RepID=UPI001457489C|nr:hypothetical protein [Rhizobium sp. P32RR-XVIII]NLS06511.1 hypothetical protein [Rhizobium sp. P32RR-XVIII]